MSTTVTVVALAMGSLALSDSSRVAQQRWSGAAECRIQVGAEGYRDQQTHQWTFAGTQPSASGAMQVHTVMWRVRGYGDLTRTQGTQTLTANWRTNGEGAAPLAMFIRASDGKLVLKSWHTQVRVNGGIRGQQQVTINGVPQRPVAIGLEAFEWAFPTIVANAGTTEIEGRSPVVVSGSASPLQPAGARVTGDCSWGFSAQP